jgi:hypothetical protein
MNPKKALNIIFWISLVGLLFSGYLSITELGTLSAGTCSAVGCQAILGLPTCLYGFMMYLIIFIISLLGK